MKTPLLIVFLIVLGSTFLASCHLTPEQRQAAISSGIRTVASADTDGDGSISSDEVRAAPTSLNFISGALNTLLLLLGGGGAVAGSLASRRSSAAMQRAETAERENQRLRSEVDELWDKTHKPATS